MSLGLPALPFLRSRRLTALAPEGHVVYAVGDIHGRLDLLVALMRKVASDFRATGAGDKLLVVFLGDYIDRGPASAQVVQYLISLNHRLGDRMRALRGNHEQAMLDFLNDPERGRAWLDFGGLETVQSYGVEIGALEAERSPEALAQALRAAMPTTHSQYYSGLRPMFIAGDYVFVHAGLRQGVPLEDQDEEDILWLRMSGNPWRWTFDKVAVHGHTPVQAVKLDGNCIGIDTGAYATGTLTALRLQGCRRRLIQATMTDATA